MKLLPPSALFRTGEVDEAEWNYRVVLGFISRRRFDMVIKLLETGRSHRLLELGYGSGIFMPKLRLHCTAIAAISTLEFVCDIEAACREIVRVLRRAGRLIVVTPGQSSLLDAGFRVLTGRSAGADFGDWRGRIRSCVAILRPTKW